MAEEGTATAAEPTTGAEGTAAAGGEGQATGQDFSPLTSRMEQMTNDFQQSISSLPQQIVESMQQSQQQQPAEPEPIYQGLEDFLGGQDDFEGEPFELDPEQLQGYIQSQVEAGIQAAVNPVQTQIQEMIEGQQSREIEQQYPELRNPETSQAAVAELAQRGVTPENMTPAMVAMAHEARRGRELMSQITPAGDGASDGLEATGGGQPGGQSAEEAGAAVANSIVGARGGPLFG